MKNVKTKIKSGNEEIDPELANKLRANGARAKNKTAIVTKNAPNEEPKVKPNLKERTETDGNEPSASGAEKSKITKPAEQSKSADKQKAAPETSEAKLTPQEAKMLKGCEAKIQRGKKTFMEVGKALADICEQRLYRNTHSNFEEYLKDRWGFGKAHAFRLMNAAVVNAEMVSNGDDLLPEKESHARLLKKLTTPQRKEAMIQAKAKAKNETPTTAHLKAAIAEIVEDEQQQEPEAGGLEKQDADEISDEPAPKVVPISLEEVLGWVETIQKNIKGETERKQTLQLLNDVVMALKLMLSLNDVEVAA